MCGQRELEVVDEQLRMVFAAVRSVADDTDRSMLDETQASWAVDREQLCLAIGRRAGSVQSLNVLACKAQMARHRAIELCDWDTTNPAEQQAPCAAVVR
mgnify:CR=1 FL=1